MTRANRSQRPIPNPVLAPETVREVRKVLTDARMEQDPWYQWNMGRLMLARKLGTVSEVIARNVARHLNTVATRRNLI